MCWAYVRVKDKVNRNETKQNETKERLQRCYDEKTRNTGENKKKTRADISQNPKSHICMGLTHTVYLYVYLWSIDKLNIQVRKKKQHILRNDKKGIRKRQRTKKCER